MIYVADLTDDDDDWSDVERLTILDKNHVLLANIMKLEARKCSL